MAFPSWPDKDPNERLDYTIDWTNKLVGSDTLASVVWTIPTGITSDTQTHDTTKTVLWLLGGVEGSKLSFNCSVTTSEGRVMDQTVTLKVKSK